MTRNMARTLLVIIPLAILGIIWYLNPGVAYFIFLVFGVAGGIIGLCGLISYLIEKAEFDI